MSQKFVYFIQAWQQLYCNTNVDDYNSLVQILALIKALPSLYFFNKLLLNLRT